MSSDIPKATEEPQPEAWWSPGNNFWLKALFKNRKPKVKHGLYVSVHIVSAGPQASVCIYKDQGWAEARSLQDSQAEL